MRALSRLAFLAALVSLLMLPLREAPGDAIGNPDFETGTFEDWDTHAEQLTIEVSTNETFNRNYAARVHGSYSGDAWITNSISQTIAMTAGDELDAVGFVYWKDYQEDTPDGDGYVTVNLEGPFESTPVTWAETNVGWVFFELNNSLFGVRNSSFEAGFDDWNVGADHLAITLDPVTVDDGAQSLHMAGIWTNGWSFNQAFQVLYLRRGDIVRARARVNVVKLLSSGGWAVAGIKLEQEGAGFAKEAAVHADAQDTGWQDLEITAAITNDGYFVFRCMVCGNPSGGQVESDVYFDDVHVWKWPVQVVNPGFETGDLDAWIVGNDHLTATVSTAHTDTGDYALRMSGGWTDWSFNQLYQVVSLRSGDVVEARGRIYLDKLDTTAGWLVAGLKLERTSGGSGFEMVYDSNADEDQWMDLGFTAQITNTGDYVFRCMVCGNAGTGQTTNDVYFDSLALWRPGEPTGDVVDVTLRMDYCGYSGGAGHQSTVDLYTDGWTIEGSTARLEEPTNVHGRLVAEAAAIATNEATDIPEVVYPRLYSYGYPGDNTNDLKFPAYIEALVAGWRFRYLTNDVALTITNTIVTYELGASGSGFMEFDQYRYCARFWHTLRGAPLQIDTNAPYFTLGVKDGSSAEFGNGPFPWEHTYVVGTSLTNFPRRLVTHYDGQWPTRLNVVFQENLGQFDRGWDKYFVLATIPTNGPDCNHKAVKLTFNVNDPGHTNLDFLTHEIHMGWATEEECYGHVDYPNLTYQDHNEVAVRAGWMYGVLDEDGWFVQQVPRGSATIEPVNIHALKHGNWIQKIYEEYLVSWPNAASGVRSIFDDDFTHRTPGPACYNVGYKIGHQFGTNEFGEPKFPQVIELRGNGYFRMTDYEGVMGGSFRPVAADIFGLHLNKEDAPLMPACYARLVSRSTPTNEDDNSYSQIFMPFRSKTNNWLIGALKVDAHFAPDEVALEGAYFELEADTYANKDIVMTNHGALCALAQVDMYWRGGGAINDYSEGHDFDAVVVKKADGEWVTHLPVNPPTNIYRRSLCRFASNDVVYLMQQDRGPNSYGFSTEAPYRKVSTFEISLLDDGGRDMKLDVYEQNTISEINDNVVVACRIDEDIARGERLHYKYRYRSIYSPGVTILAPDDTGGGEAWGDNTCTIDFYATDGEDKLLQANLYYGNGRDEDWTLINEGELLLVPTNTHRMTYAWDVSGVPPGAYYVKVAARRVEGGKIGFDVSNTRIQVGDTCGFPNNGTTNEVVITNAVGYLGNNMSFETGDVLGWASAGDHLDIYATSTRAYDGTYSARMRGAGWTDWSWNNLQQEIPCVSGEVLHVTGRIYIGQLVRGGTNWVACGIKMEATNDNGNAAGQEFKETITTGVWLNVDFQRTVPVDGTDRLILWVGGYDCGGADVFFDDLRVTSTNTGIVVTNRVRTGYWEGDVAVDVSGHDALAFRLSGTGGGDGVRVWAADETGVTNAVYVTNHIDRVVSLPRRVVVPWSSFPVLDRSRLIALGFASDGTNTWHAQAMRSLVTPCIAKASFVWPPTLDPEGLPLYNPGQTITNVVTVENLSGAALTGLVVQLVQEYGTNVMWLDTSPHVASRWSEKTRVGDRLCGDYEQRWSNATILAGGALVLTNTYALPRGKLINHTQHVFTAREDWYVYRNYESRGRLHLVIRTAAGDNVYDSDQVAVYAIDDDFDIDNDGLPDAWETEYGGGPTSMDPYDDPDGDGYSNLAEYEAGSDPTDPNSYPGHLTSYVVHLAYTNGTDLFPRAVAEQSNYTGAACGWMIVRYLNGESFTQSQDQIYGSNANDPQHNAEITPQSVARWMWTNTVEGYYFSARYRTNLADALKESVYWMDYVPPGGQKTPVYILCGTNWSYKVVRGFESDRKPYDGGFGVTTDPVFTIYGLWLNDPRMSGLGYDVFATAEEMASIYYPSEITNTAERYWLVAEPPQDAEQMAAAVGEIDGARVELAAPEGDAAFASYLTSLFTRPSKAGRSGALARDLGDGEPPAGSAQLYAALPQALKDDPGFMAVFNQAGATNYYLVNPGEGSRSYYLAAGGVRGPGSTVYVLMLATNAAMREATWSASPSLYLPVSLDAAAWAARKELGAGPPGENELLNASFETNAVEGGGADDWTVGAAAGAYSWGGHSGTWLMGVASWVGDHGYFYQTRPAADVSGYTFSVWMSKDSGFTASSIEMKIEWYASDMTPLGAAVRDVAPDVTVDWQVFSLAASKPASAYYVRVTVFAGGVAGSGALKCDDAALTAGGAEPVLVSYRLVYDEQVDVSPFMPRWQLVFDVGGTRVTNAVAQDYDLSGDADGDGMSDKLELYAGLDADDPLSLLTLGGSWATVEQEQAIITWPSRSGRTYSVYRTIDLHEPFAILEDRLQATPPVNSYADPAPPSPSYYRIEVE